MKNYRITCVVEKELVPTITALIIDRVVSYHVEEVTKDSGARTHTRRATPTRHGNFLERPAIVAITDFLARHPGKSYHYSELGKQIIEHGLNAKSVTPIISKLAKLGVVERVSQGMYKLK